MDKAAGFAAAGRPVPTAGLPARPGRGRFCPTQARRLPGTRRGAEGGARPGCRPPARSGLDPRGLHTLCPSRAPGPRPPPPPRLSIPSAGLSCSPGPRLAVGREGDTPPRPGPLPLELPSRRVRGRPRVTPPPRPRGAPEGAGQGRRPPFPAPAGRTRGGAVGRAGALGRRCLRRRRRSVAADGRASGARGAAGRGPAGPGGRASAVAAPRPALRPTSSLPGPPPRRGLPAPTPRVRPRVTGQRSQLAVGQVRRLRGLEPRVFAGGRRAGGGRPCSPVDLAEGVAGGRGRPRSLPFGH